MNDLMLIGGCMMLGLLIWLLVLGAIIEEQEPVEQWIGGWKCLEEIDGECLGIFMDTQTHVGYCEKREKICVERVWVEHLKQSEAGE